MDENRFKISKVNKDGCADDTDASRSGITLRAYNLMRKASRKISANEMDQRKFSFAQLTREALPRLDNYRLSKRLKRPSIGALHGEVAEGPQQSNQDPENPSATHSHIKLGWINGVVIPVLLNIWGVMLFLRLSWVVAQSGIIQSLIIIGISTVVCVITTLSLSAISTNGEVKSGGVYFIISRTLGPEFGASVGVVFAFANAVAASMNTIGFCSSLNDLLASYDLKIIDGGNNDIRIVGVVTILVLILICCVGMEWESKAQNFLVVTIVLAIFNFMIGVAVGPGDDKERIAKGFVGFRTDTFAENMNADYRFSEGVYQDFFSVFAIFFPSVTGIQAGANISGDLKDPASAIPKGTLLAVLISMVSYALFVIFAGGAALRDASGDIADVINGTLIGSHMECKLNNTCPYGLQNSYSVMQLMSLWGPLIYAGCFAATLSTALTNLLSVPRLVQALGIDRIYPGLIFFSKPYGKHGEPYRGYVLTFFISAAFVLIAELNVIAPLISNFYLASYALINFCTFHAAFVKPLGWRPTFKYYNVWLSLIGTVMCVVIMFLIEWKSSLITLAVIFALYLVVVYRKPDVNWGSSTQAQMYTTALSSAQRLQTISDHVKNYRPQVLVLIGDPQDRPLLLDFAHLITKRSSLLIAGRVMPEPISYKTRMSLLKEGNSYLNAKKIKSFYTIVDGLAMEDGVNALIKASGFGKMSPNMVLMGYKQDWQTCKIENLTSYFNVLHLAFASRMALAILRLPEGADFSNVTQEIKIDQEYVNTVKTVFANVNGLPNGNGLQIPDTSVICHADSNLNLAGMARAASESEILSDPQPGTPSSNESNSISMTPLPNSDSQATLSVPAPSSDIIYSTKGGSAVPQSVLNALTYFTRKQSKGTIDIWWLYDDGGLTMLLPYILSTRSNWSSCKLRVFALASPKMDLEVEEKNVANLLDKLRIQYSALVMLQGITDKPKQSTIDEHEALLSQFQEGVNDQIYVPDVEMVTLREKTYRQLRLHEMLQEHSKNASLIFMSLPMPRQQSNQDPENPSATHSHIKLGWINGVVIPVLLNIWGVMLFLRLSWVVAQSGIIQSLIIIGISTVVCVITTLSLSAISTNGEVKSGGVYFIISRTLGPEFGASVGVVFAFANAVAASMNTIGFCSSLNDLLASYDLKIIDGGNNDIRIVGVVTILVLILICCVGMEWESKAQNFLVVTIVLAIFNFMIGVAVGPGDDKERIAKGFVGFRTDTFAENMNADYRFSEGVYQDFFSVFAIFFPSVTGIQAGANISGDLKDPASAIPKGTLLAVLISMVSYALFVIFAGGAALRDASGDIADVINGTLIGSHMECKLNNTCPYGLQNSYSVMQLMSLWGPLIYAGCFAATLSTALTNLLSVPRLVQALGIDRIYPGLIFFSKPYGKHGEPYRGYVLTFFISAAFVLIAELNVIAPLISNFYLASYALINFCTFHAAFVKPLGWRPTFKYYNVWLSLIGTVMCVVIMFLIEWKSSLITLAVIFALYLVVVYRKPDVNWGSSTQAQMYTTALSSAQRLQTISDHVKNYRPQVLVLIGDPQDRPLLLDFAHLITKRSSLLIAGRVMPEPISYKTRMNLLKEGNSYLNAKKIKSFYTIVDGLPMEDGVNALIKASGFGKMSPNMVLMGYKQDWQTCKIENLTSYFNVLHLAFASRMALAILRLPEGADFSNVTQEIKIDQEYVNTVKTVFANVNGLPNGNGLQIPDTSVICHADSNLNLAGMARAASESEILSDPQPGTPSSNASNSISMTPLPNSDSQATLSVPAPSSDIIYSTKGGSAVPQSVLNALTYFTRKQSKGTIDIWWLYDDGGLTMLLPYILSTRSNWSSCKLRVFALASPKMDLEVEEKNVANLLDKLRIQYSALVMLQGITDKPKQSTIDEHEALLSQFQEGVNDQIYVPDVEMVTLREKTYRQLRLHEMLQEHSKNASLIFMSLPMPRQEAVSAPLYMSWLEMLTKDIACPFILVRGNHTPVLTFYS